MKLTLLTSFITSLLYFNHYVESSSSCTSPISSGTVNVNKFGTNTEMAVIVSGGDTSGVLVNSQTNAITVNHNYRAYIVNDCPQSFTNTTYNNAFPLLGNTMTVTLDLSHVPCACNAAFYWTLMPAINSSQLPDPTTCGDYYADANKVCGLWAPEMDSLEANNNAMQITPHQCDTPIGKYYPSCDRDGCGFNIYRHNASAYGPGNNYTINTLLPFVYSASFVKDPASGNLTSIAVTLSQPARNSIFTYTITDNNCNKPGYLSALSYAFDVGMTPILSLWGDSASTMSWLDIPPCSDSVSCDPNSYMIVSDFSITSNA